MKKFIFIILTLFCLSCTNLFAQESDFTSNNFQKNEFYVSGGLPSGEYFAIKILAESSIIFFDAFQRVVCNEFNSTPGELPNLKKSFGVYSIGYNYYFNNHWEIGGELNYESFFGVAMLTPLVKGTFQYGWDKVKFYHSVGLGASIFPTANQAIFNYNATLFGVKVLFNQFTVFAEENMGACSSLKIGTSYKF